jgi:flagellar basal body-associated protein FliL
MKAPSAGGNAGSSGRMLRILLIAAMVIAVAVAMYIFVKPQ